MKKRISVTRDGRPYKITLDTSVDIELYDGYEVNSNRWTSYYVHQTNNNELHFYSCYISQWQNEDSYITEMSKEDFFNEIPASWDDNWIRSNNHSQQVLKDKDDLALVKRERKIVDKIIKMDVPEL